MVSIVRKVFDSTEDAGFAALHLIEEGAGRAGFVITCHRRDNCCLLYQVDGAKEKGVAVDGDVFFHNEVSFVSAGY